MFSDVRVLLDNSILCFAGIAEPTVKEVTIHWGSVSQTIPVQGVRRKPLNPNARLQSEIDALFTIGRLIREKQVTAYTYNELLVERVRGRAELRDFNALRNCKIEHCRPALERSRFVRTASLKEWFAKGGKRDKLSGSDLGSANQVAFMQFLLGLTTAHIEVLLQHTSLLKFTEFEQESLKQLTWFQEMSDRAQTPEHYPDVFHLWTAERNGLDAFLTLDFNFANLISRIREQKKRRKPIEIRTKVLLPVQLLNQLGITNPDPVPIQEARFYHLHEVPD